MTKVVNRIIQADHIFFWLGREGAYLCISWSLYLLTSTVFTAKTKYEIYVAVTSGVCVCRRVQETTEGR